MKSLVNPLMLGGDANLGESRTPALNRRAFYCVHCEVFAAHSWGSIQASWSPANTAKLPYKLSTCSSCGGRAIWSEADGVVVDSPTRLGPLPAGDMPEQVRVVYDEARAVSALSRKSAAGLLRLTLQMLVDELQPGPGGIDAKIGRLVADGLAPRVQQAMDVLRVVGNEAVHPGQIDLDADDELLPGLFTLINLIVDQAITQPKEVAALFGALPERKREAIQRRDTRPPGAPI